MFKLLVTIVVASGLPLLLLYLQGSKREEKQRKRKERKREGKDLCNNGRGPSFINLFFFSQLHARAMFWVQIPKEFYMKNKYKNVLFAYGPRFMNEQYLQPEQNSYNL